MNCGFSLPTKRWLGLPHFLLPIFPKCTAILVMEVTPPFNTNPVPVHHSSLRLQVCSLHCLISLICANPLDTFLTRLPYTYLVHHKAWFCIQMFCCACFQGLFLRVFVPVAISRSWLLAIKKSAFSNVISSHQQLQVMACVLSVRDKVSRQRIAFCLASTPLCLWHRQKPRRKSAQFQRLI